MSDCKLTHALNEATRRYHEAGNDWRAARRAGDRTAQSAAESRQAQAANDQKAIRRAMQLVDAA